MEIKSSIKRLAPEVASKIAAGEVAERPFNVVKELMENAVDAGATKIIVEISDGGLSLVRITDNGKGISKEDLPLAPERFATSKAVSVEDVYDASTFGFRGEALAAISAVSDFTITSGIGDGTAYELKSRFGQVGEVKPAPPITGTVVEALNLFENVPARRKFLKSSKSLENEIVRFVKHFSLINLGIEISLICNSKEVFAISAREDITIRASKVFSGKGFYKGEAVYENSKVTVAATLPSESDRLKRDAIILGVNGRLIKDASLIQAVIRAYFRLIPDGRYPCAAVDIRIPAAEVDANVHPAKMEVRFENPRAIFALVSDAASNAFDGKGVNVSSGYSQLHATSCMKLNETPVINEKDLEFKGDTDKKMSPLPDNLVDLKPTSATLRQSNIIEDVKNNPFNRDIDDIFHNNNIKAKPKYAFNIGESNMTEGKAQNLPSTETFESKIAAGDFKITGQIDNSYIVCETEDKNILFIDQHAAHERILFEKNQAKNRSSAKAAIVLHEPAPVDITDEILEILQKEEIAFENFGYAFNTKPLEMRAEITRIPYSSSRRDYRQEFLDIARDLCLTGASKTQDAPVAMLSCKTAIKAGDSLTDKEMQYLVQLLFNTNNFGTCPHGRPIIYSMSVGELARKFLR